MPPTTDAAHCAAGSDAPSPPAPLRVLFLCTANACRSQIAEGWARHLLGGSVIAASAGVAPAGLDPRAVAAMAEAGVDIGGQRSKTIAEAERETGPFDLVVTVCDHAAESCPIFPGEARVLHHGFPDPAGATGTPQQVAAAFRDVRDRIRAFVERLPQQLAEPASAQRGKR